MKTHRKGIIRAAVLLFLFQSLTAFAQEFEPRRWSHLPIDLNFAGSGYAYTWGNIGFDPVLELEDVSVDIHSVAVKYIRTMKCLNRSARVDITAPYATARWEGLQKNEPASTSRNGFSDPRVRFSMNLVGAPPLKGANFARYQTEHPIQTTLSGAIGVQVPLGQYDQSKLLNLGQNRFIVRPALGALHTHRKWLAEVTGSVALFTDNKDFWGDNLLEQDPLYIMQFHLAYTFRPGLWLSAGTAFAWGGDSYINAVNKYTQRADHTWGLGAGIPISKTVGLKLGYFAVRTGQDTGIDSDTVSTAVSVMW